jgi:hypothetical protein
MLRFGDGETCDLTHSEKADIKLEHRKKWNFLMYLDSTLDRLEKRRHNTTSYISLRDGGILHIEVLKSATKFLRRDDQTYTNNKSLRVGGMGFVSKNQDPSHSLLRSRHYKILRSLHVKMIFTYV